MPKTKNRKRTDVCANCCGDGTIELSYGYEIPQLLTCPICKGKGRVMLNSSTVKQSNRSTHRQKEVVRVGGTREVGSKHRAKRC